MHLTGLVGRYIHGLCTVPFLASPGVYALFGPQGTLAQIHLMEPGQPDTVILAVLLAFFGGATLVGSAQTLNGLKNGTLSIRFVQRIVHFFVGQVFQGRVVQDPHRGWGRCSTGFFVM